MQNKKIIKTKHDRKANYALKAEKKSFKIVSDRLYLIEEGMLRMTVSFYLSISALFLVSLCITSNYPCIFFSLLLRFCPGLLFFYYLKKLFVKRVLTGESEWLREKVWERQLERARVMEKECLRQRGRDWERQRISCLSLSFSRLFIPISFYMCLTLLHSVTHSFSFNLSYSVYLCLSFSFFYSYVYMHTHL